MKDYYTYDDATTTEWVLRHYWATLKKDQSARHEFLVATIAIACTFGVVYLLGLLKSNGVW